MWHNGMGFDPGLFFVLGFFKVLGWLLLLGLIFGALRFFRRGRFAGQGWGGRGGWNPRGMMGGNWSGRDEALETVRLRLAKSELTPEQFEEIKRSLVTQQSNASEWRSSDGWQDMKREFRGMSRNWGGKDGALETARMRFAKGEISSEEFEMIKRALES
jgi:hypothetical protein